MGGSIIPNRSDLDEILKNLVEAATVTRPVLYPKLKAAQAVV